MNILRTFFTLADFQPRILRVFNQKVFHVQKLKTVSELHCIPTQDGKTTVSCGSNFEALSQIRQVCTIIRGLS